MITQVLFLALNGSLFSINSLKESFQIVVGGFYYCLMSVSLLLSPYIILLLIPHPFRYKKWYLTVCDVYYYTVSTLIFIANLVDVIFYRFTYRRMTADIFNYLGVGGDFNKLIPQFLQDFWYMLLIFILFISLFVWIASRAKIKQNNTRKNLGYYVKHTAFCLVAVFVCVIIARGGFQLRPVQVINAIEYTSPGNIPLVVNTPFSIAHTWQKEPVPPVHYFNTEDELNLVYNPVKQYDVSKSELPVNVVIIILESFSSEYIGGISGKESYTPFLDSLIKRSLVYHGLANGKRSIDGIPAVIASMPLLMRDSYITSPYSINTLNSIPGLLKEMGYATSFFHGGSNGTMGFNTFCKSVGVSHYYGRNEYDNDKDYDGKWGIFDEPFLQYMVKVLTEKEKQPFCATVFTLSSHHPYTIPEKYTGRFKKGTLPIHPTIGYADLALKEFFESAARTDWYENTLFVITSDHTAQSQDSYYKNSVGMYEIPIILYRPNVELKGFAGKFVQQTDIMPSVLQYAGYNKPFVCFGESIFDSTATNFHATYVNDEYQLIKGDYMIIFDEDKINRLYNIKQDPLLTANLLGQYPKLEQEMLLFMKAVIQQYNNRLRENRNSIP